MLIAKARRRLYNPAAGRTVLKNAENGAPRNYSRNRIGPAGDDPVTGSHQSLRASSRRILCCRNANPLHYLRWSPVSGLLRSPRRCGAENAMVCSCVCPVAIAATWTSSAAALDAQVERGKYLSSANSLWEPLMLDSSESVNRVVRRYDVPSRDLRDNSGTKHDKRAQTPRLDFVDVNLPPDGMPTGVPNDPTIIALWPVFTSFMEGFAL